jgi:hypothetical protein
VFGLTLAGTLAAATTMVAWAPAARADGGNPNDFHLSAEGDGMLVHMLDGINIAVADVGISPYTSQAAVDSNGASGAFAGMPYTGALQTIAGTVNGLSAGGTPPIPPSPGYVESSYPSKADSQESQGPYLVQAHSTQYASNATAGFGLSPSAASSNQQIFSKASVIANPDGSVSSTATAGVDALSIGPLDILNISSTETMTSTGSGPPTVTGSTSVGTIKVLGFTLGIDDKGFTVLGAGVSLPTATILNTINTALGNAHIQISILPATTTPVSDTDKTIKSVTSSVFQVTTVQTIPSQGETTVIYDFGRATVSATDAKSAFGDFGSGLDTGLGLTTDMPSTPATPTTDTSSAPATSTTDTPGAATVDTSGSSGAAALPAPETAGTAGAVSEPVVAPAVVAPDTTGTGQAQAGPTAPRQLPRTLGFVSAAATTGTSGSGVYLTLLLGAAGILAGALLFRQFGVRLLFRG